MHQRTKSSNIYEVSSVKVKPKVKSLRCYQAAYQSVKVAATIQPCPRQSGEQDHQQDEVIRANVVSTNPEAPAYKKVSLNFNGMFLLCWVYQVNISEKYNTINYTYISKNWKMVNFHPFFLRKDPLNIFWSDHM